MRLGNLILQSVKRIVHFRVRELNEQFPHQNQAKEDSLPFIKKFNQDMTKAAIEYADKERTIFFKTEKMKPFILTEICIDIMEHKSWSSGLEGIPIPMIRECHHPEIDK